MNRIAGWWLILAGFAGGEALRDWLWVFGLIAVGFSAMFVLSAFGGIGGKSGNSMWRGIMLLSYPISLVIGIVSLVPELFKGAQLRHVTLESEGSP